MTLSAINVGSSANDGTGDSVRAAFQKTNLAIAAANAGVQVATVSATAAQLRNAFSVPIDLVPAQGAGKIIMPLFVIPRYTAGSYNFNAASFPYFIAKMGTQESGPLTDFTAMLQSLSLSGGLVIPSTAMSAWLGYIAPWTEQNAPFQLASQANMVGGAVATVAVGNSGGSGYLVGDGPYVNATGNVVYEVTSVDGGGAVTGIAVSAGNVADIENPGTNLVTGGGSGTGLTLDITVNVGDGSVDFTTIYMAV